MARSAYAVQRDFALSSGLRSEIIWDSLSAEQSDVLKQKIANIICERENKTAKQLEQQREQLFQNVWQQRIYTNGTLLSSIIYVLVTLAEKDEALNSTSFSCHPVIRTRRCLRILSDGSVQGGNSENCCMNFIDEYGRVYSNWEQYLRNNTLPKGIMIAPKEGIYRFEEDEEQVQLLVQSTPSSWLKQKILSAGDNLATVGGLVASVPIAATLALPVAAPVILAATVVGVSTAAYSTVRSATRLLDRRWHCQSISPRHREARSSWLGVAGGIAGMGSTGATRALSLMQGKPQLAAQLAVQGINVSSIVLSGTGMLNGVYDFYLKLSDEEPVSGYDMLQLASSLLIFTHSINNLRLVSKVTNGSSLRRVMRQQTRNTLQRIYQEQKTAATGKQFKFDIVRTLNDIPIKEALLGMHKLNQGAGLMSAVGATGLLPSFVMIGSGGQLRLNLEQLASQFGLKFVQQIGHLSSFMDVLDALTQYLCDKGVQLLLQLTRSFVEQQVDGIDRTLQTFVSTELVLYHIVTHCINNYEHLSADFLEQRRQQILDVISKYFQSLQPQPAAEDGQKSRRRKCRNCQGVYFISTL